jgi:hypothetical protein
MAGPTAPAARHPEDFRGGDTGQAGKSTLSSGSRQFWLAAHKVKKDYTAAGNSFKEGVKLGDADSMVSYAELIDRGYETPQNAAAVKFALIARAAQLGHAGALAAFEKERAKYQQQNNEQQMQWQQQMVLKMFWHRFAECSQIICAQGNVHVAR